MATETPKPSATPPAIDWKRAEDHLAAVKKKIMDYAGKPGFNPFMWWRDKGEALELALTPGRPRTPELHAKVLAVQFEEPVAPAMGVKIKQKTPVKPS